MHPVSIASAAAELDMHQRDLLAKLREIRWTNRENQPFISIRLKGLMQAKQQYYRDGEGHPMPCRRKTPFLTRAGITELKRILETEAAA